MKRKLISVITIVIILFNFICASTNCVYASSFVSGVEGEQTTNDTKMGNTYKGDDSSISNSTGTAILEDGKADNGTGNEQSLESSSFGESILGFVLGILAGIVNTIVFQLDIMVGQLTCADETTAAGTGFQYFFTIERTVFNRIPLFNINYFNMDSTYEVGDVTLKASPSINAIKAKVAETFYLVRIIAVALALMVLIFIGIRMAISTVADEKAKYKKMLMGWVESIVVLFLLEYIMVAVITLGEFFTGIFYNIEQELLGPDGEIFESVVRMQLFTYLFNSAGLQYATNSLTYWILLFMQLKYFWLYIKRVLMVGFLIMIAPLITVTYAIDKAGDGKAQAFSIWTKEFAVNVLIQPLHALIYLVFVLSAGEIAKTSPIIAIAFIMCMGAVERMIKVVFSLKGLVSLRGVDKMGKKQ